MTLARFLATCAKQAIVAPAERQSIKRSIKTLRARLDEYFQGEIAEQIEFGSYTRQTNLPRSLDELSDVDHMVVFANGGVAPQAYLQRLRRFAEHYYSRSELYQSHPTIVLELNHIKFDLVPALRNFLGVLKIPDREDGWRWTSPSSFSRSLEERNAQCDGHLKPAIRLTKVWNAANDYPFASFELENWIVDQSYFMCSELPDYFFSIMRNLPAHSLPAKKHARLRQVQALLAEARRLANSQPQLARAAMSEVLSF